VGPDLSIDTNGQAPDPSVVNAAVEACKDLENGVWDQLRPSDEAFAQLQERSNNFASCMSDHGVDIGTPNVFRNKVGIGVSFPGYDKNAAGFDAAYAACRDIMDAFG
jgi:hypothetical protein